MKIEGILRGRASSPQPPLWRREFILIPLVMAALFLLIYGRFLWGGQSVVNFQDNTYITEPLFSHISRSFSQGEYPYRIGQLMGGLRLFDQPNFSLIYPLYFFRWGLYGNPVETIAALNYVTLLHIFIAYFNCYVLLRVLRLRPLPALLGASLFAFGPNMIGYGVWIEIIAPYSWLPLAIAGAVLILEDRHPKVGVGLATLALTLMVLAGPAHALIHAFYLILVLYLFRAARLWKRGERRELYRVSRNLIATGGLTLALCAPVLVPVLLEMPNSIRFCGDQPPVIGFSRLSYSATLIGQLEIKHLAGTLLPYYVPSLVGASFFGMGATLLALLAVFRARACWVVMPLLFAGLYALASATGSHLGLARVNYLLPLINKFREPDRHLFIFTLTFAALAAFGFDYLVGTLRAGYKRLLDWKHLSLAAIFFAALAFSWRADLQYVGVHSKWYLLGASALPFAVLFALPRAGGMGRTAIALLAASLIVYANLQYPLSRPSLRENEYFETQNQLSHQALSEVAQLADARNYRVIYADKELDAQKWSMNATYYDLRSFQAYLNPLPYRQFMQIYHTQSYPPQYPLILGARFYICDACDTEALRDYRFEREVGAYKLYVNDRALPRYALISRVAGVYETEQDFFERVKQDYDFANEAYIDRADAERVQSWIGGQTPASVREIKEDYSSLNGVRLRVETDERAILLLNEYYDTAWRATVNGQSVKTVKLNLNQIGVPVDKGASVVELEYEPRLYVWLLWEQRLLILILGLYALYRAYLSTRGRSTGATG